MKPGIHSLGKNTSGSVAPTVALSMFALVAAGGIAFDYAHMASLDTELQDAADQAALAAVTQLDGHPGAIKAATDVAQSLLANRTLFANDSNASGTAVTIPTVTFYQTASDAEANANAVTADDKAHFVRVVVAARRAIFALTPVVGAVTSGDLGGEAVAGLRSAICKIPPLMMCNPAETGSSTSFDPTAYIGKGIKLVSVGNGGGAWQAGDFGYLQNNNGVNGAPGLRQLLGWNNVPGNCLNVDSGDTKPGANTTVTDSVNTRFDILDNSNTSCPSGGTCSSALNSAKDVVRPQTNPSCSVSGSGWQLLSGAYESSTLPTSNTASLPVTTIPPAMGHPRDMCHAGPNGAGHCNGPIGDGNWDRDAYFRTNYVRTVTGTHGAAGSRWTGADWISDTGLNAQATRYQVYSWETNHALQLIDGVTVLGNRNVSTQMAQGQGGKCTPLAPANVPDRRRVTVAVVNCTANNVHGNSVGVPIEKWIDVFLVEPSLNRARTNAGDIYVEVIEETTGATLTSTGGGQVTRRDVPYLIQ